MDSSAPSARANPLRNKKDRAPLPSALPGRFLLLVWDRDREQFVLYVDDPARSSYKVGREVRDVMAVFKRYGLGEFGNQCIDIAKEFGACQGVFRDRRTIPVYQRPSQMRRSVWAQQPAASGLVQLPSLG